MDTSSKDWGDGCYFDPPHDQFFLLPIPLGWLDIRFDFMYWMDRIKTVCPPSYVNITIDELPWWMIECPHKFKAYFLFKDEIEALVFKLTYL